MIQASAFLPAYFSSTICIGLLAAILILMSGIRQKRPEFLALTLLCVLGLVYQYLTWKYHTSSTLESSIYWLKMQSLVAILILPPYFFTFAKWSMQPKAEIWTYAISVFAVVIIILNFSSTFSLRFSSVSQLDFITLWSGETISIIRGEQSKIALAAHWVSVLVLISLALMVRRLYLIGAVGISIILGFSLFMQFLASIIGISIDNGTLDFIYVSALPLILLSASICALGAYSLRLKSQEFTSLHEKHTSLEYSLTELAKGVNTSNSDDFYQQMLESLYKLSHADYIFLGLKETNNGTDYIATKTVLKNGELIPNFTYELKDTPCANVMNNDTCMYKSNVANLFPNDHLLAEMDIEAYLGTPLLGESANLIGILTLLHTQPMKKIGRVQKAVQIFAARASAEIRRDNIETQLRSLAYIDYATGLASKVRAHEVLNQTLKLRELDNKNALLMLIDISGFSKLNHRMGYDIGEEILRELGNRLTEYQNDNVFVARYGGDEFAIICKQINQQPVQYMHEQWEIIQKILCKPIQKKSGPITLSYNMGAVIFPEQTGRTNDVFQCAEMALAETKKAANREASLFEPESLIVRDRYQLIYTQLNLAIGSSEQLSMVYQPKTTKNGQLVGLEALIRWKNPVHGHISPAEFIPIAEASGLITELGNWVVSTVCQQIVAWRQNGFECKVAINVSASQLLNTDFVSFFVDTLEKHSIKPSLIEIEITESGLIDDITTASIMLKKFREIGLSIALDDFGTGYSSLSYLRELPLDVLKIDKAFVDKINEESAAALVKTIIAIGKQLSLGIVAEGTEEKQQVDILAEMGCEYFQGYYFSRPISGEAVLNWNFSEIPSSGS